MRMGDGDINWGTGLNNDIFKKSAVFSYYLICPGAWVVNFRALWAVAWRVFLDLCHSGVVVKKSSPFGGICGLEVLSCRYTNLLNILFLLNVRRGSPVDVPLIINAD